MTEMDGARRHATAMMQCLFKCLAVKSRRNLEGVDDGGRGKASRSALGAMEHSEQQGGDGDQRRLAGAVSSRVQGRRAALFGSSSKCCRRRTACIFNAKRL